MALHNLGIRFRKINIPASDLTVTNIGTTYATLNLKVGSPEGHLYAVILPEGATAPTAAQIAAYATAPISGEDGWSGNGPIINVGSGAFFLIEGPTGLAIASDWSAYVVQKFADNSYSSVLTADFSTLGSAPLLVSTTPSHNWKTVGLTDNIYMVFDQTITLGTGNIVLRDTDTNADAQTIDVTTCTRTTTNFTNDTLVINPSNLTARKNYAVTVGANCVKNANASQSYAGIASYTVYAFRAGYAAGNAETIAGAETDVMAFDLTDNSAFIKNTGGSLDYDGTWSGKVTVTGTLAASESGMRLTNANYATIATSLFPYSNTAGTLIVECSAEDFDTAAGTGTPGYAVMMFASSSTTGSPSSHYLSLSKSDSGGRSANLQSSSRNEAGTTYAAEITSPAGLFPKGGNFKVIGMSWDATSLIVADEDNSATSAWGAMPDDFLALYFGYTVSTLYFDLRRGIYIPSKLNATDLRTRIGSFLDFVSA